jgi:twitching motility protein PilT
VKRYPKSIHEVLERGLELKASDIFLTGGEHVAYKCDGRWRRETAWDPLDDGVAEQLILAMAPRLAQRREEARTSPLERDMDFSYTIASGFRFRVNLYHIQGRPAVVIRPIPTEPPRIDTLGLPVEAILQALKQRTGLILVTGATGSGKSTTLAAMIDWLNETQEIHIVTIEDPIEFYFTPKRAIISQREVGSDTESFAVALRAALRQAPNVIMVGEMRDLETMTAALTAAETGHLVLATLHTGSAPEAIDRVVNAFPEGRRDMIRLQLANTLRLVLTQVLVPRREGEGRVLLYEVLVNTPAVSTMIRDGKTAQLPAAMQTGAAYGMVTMEQVAAQLLERGVIAPAVVEGTLRRSPQTTGF